MLVLLIITHIAGYCLVVDAVVLEKAAFVVIVITVIVMVVVTMIVIVITTML